MAGLRHKRPIFVQSGSPEDFNEFLKKERQKWQKVVRESGATVD
jgi:tripartite-type tricarboxylate transporter receptor subunit TctC